MDSAVGGGIANEANGPRTTVAGGYNNIASDSNATVGGGYGNLASGSQSTIGGGKQNTASGICSTIGSGCNNTASGNESTVGGGLSNTASALRATVGGGDSITASGLRSTISGGYSNTSGNEYATVAGGSYNQATGKWATIPGGRDNQANADYSFAAGYYARVRAADSGALIWADSTGGVLESTGTNQFLVRASGGTKIFSNSAASAGVPLAAGGGSWSTICDRNAKDNFASVDGREVLDRLASIPIETWNYKSQDESIRHIGLLIRTWGKGDPGRKWLDRELTTARANRLRLTPPRWQVLRRRMISSPSSAHRACTSRARADSRSSSQGAIRTSGRRRMNTGTSGHSGGRVSGTKRSHAFTSPYILTSGNPGCDDQPSVPRSCRNA